MPTLQGVIDAPILRTIAKEVLALIKNDQALRELQGANAPRASYFTRASITGNVQHSIVEAQSGNEIFTALVVTFDTSSGLGFYRVDGIPPTPTNGVEIPAGGGILTIVGHDNIRGFSMVAQAAATLTFARYLYK